MYRKEQSTYREGSVLPVVSGIHRGSWNVPSMDKGGLLLYGEYIRKISSRKGCRFLFTLSPPFRELGKKGSLISCRTRGGTCPTFPGLGWGSCAGGPGSRGFEPHYFAVTPPALDTPESFVFPKV